MGVTLSAQGDRLRVNAPQGTLSRELRGELERRKPALLAILEGAPASFAQRRLWFLDRLMPGHPFYNVAAAFRLSGRLDAAALQSSLRAVVRRHESLRTRFVECDGEPYQVVDPPTTPDLVHRDVNGLPEERSCVALSGFVREEARRAFDLARGPLLRAHLVRLETTEHVLLVVLHHIVCDHWSVRLLLRDLFGFYAATVGADPPEPPASAGTMRYADYAIWQRRWARSAEAAERLAWWRRTLEGAPERFTLPLDRPRPAIQSHAGAQSPFELPGGTVEALQRVGRQEGATLFMTLLAAFAALLRRCGAGADLVLGTPVSGRSRAELEEVVGCFANTLPLRLDLGGDPTFRELLRRVRESCLGVYAHDDVPFELLVEDRAPARSLGHAPIVQVLFQLLNAPAAPLAAPGLRLEPIPIDNGTAKFDLTVFLREKDDGGLAGIAEFATDLFDTGGIGLLTRRYERLAGAAAASPDRPIGDLPILEPEETRRLLVTWNDTRVPSPPDALLHRLVEARAEGAPEATAVVCGRASLTSGDLLARSSRLAHALRPLGARPGAVVGVCLERSVDLVAALLGILRSGAAYLPLEPDHPAGHLAGLLAEAAPCAVVTHAATAGRLPGHPGVARLDLDADREVIERLPERAPDATVTPDDLAYVLFTSGTTGRPKGVMIPHRGICNRLLWMQDAFTLGPDDRVLHKTPLGFDVSVWELFWPLLAGAGLVVARPGGHRDPAYLLRLIAERGVTVAHFVPSVLDLMLREPGLESNGATLRHVVCSGEALQPETQRRFFERLPHAALHNLYGPTEVSIDVTAWRCRPDDGRDFVPLGGPIANTRVYLLDRRLRPVPPGATGEIHLGGDGLARGYFGRPDLTAASFVPDPFDAAGGRLYRTGDLGRFRSDLTLEYLGRRDGQVKVRGARVEPGGIESVLRSLPGVRAAAVVAATAAPGDVRLVAYVVPDAERGVDGTALRDLLRGRLPDHSVPSLVVPLDALPLTPNGKLDRRALPAPDWSARPVSPGDTRPPAAPRTPIEAAMARIWSEVLRVETVGVEDDFFALGGHSLLAVQIVSRVRATLGIDLPVRALFETPRLADLAAAAARLGVAAPSTPLPPLVALPRPAARTSP
jgi:amino acid adenylation domain-containing protein